MDGKKSSANSPPTAATKQILTTKRGKKISDIFAAVITGGRLGKTEEKRPEHRRTCRETRFKDFYLKKLRNGWCLQQNVTNWPYNFIRERKGEGKGGGPCGGKKRLPQRSIFELIGV